MNGHTIGLIFTGLLLLMLGLGLFIGFKRAMGKSIF